MREKRLRGFTLTEALIVVSLFSLVSLAVYSTVVNGYRIWDRTREFRNQEDVLLFLDRFGQDSRNSLGFSRIPFWGRPMQCSFASLVRVRGDRAVFDDGRFVEQLGRVEYFFNKQNGTIIRKVAHYGMSLRGDYIEERTIVRSVQSAHFSYFVPLRGKLTQVTRLEGDLPVFIKVELEVKDTNRGVQAITRLFPVSRKKEYAKEAS